MGATWNPDITVNILSAGQAVNRRSFGLTCLCTADVGAGFTELYRMYESNNDVQTDADLLTDTKAMAANFYSQKLHPAKLMVAKVVYASINTGLDALIAAVPYTADPYYFICLDRAAATLTLLATWAEANERIAGIQSEDAAILAGTAGNLFEVLSTASRSRTIGLFHDADEYGDAAWLARGASADPDTFASIWYDQTLIGCTPTSVTAAQKATVLGYDGNLYLTLKGVGATGVGKTFSGDWIDEIVAKDWLQARIEESVAQLKLDVAARLQRIPQSNAGMAMLESAVRVPCNKGVRVGHFSSYTITVIDETEFDPADVIARHATISATCVLTGGVRTVTVNVGVIAAE